MKGEQLSWSWCGFYVQIYDDRNDIAYVSINKRVSCTMCQLNSIHNEYDTFHIVFPEFSGVSWYVVN